MLASKIVKPQLGSRVVHFRDKLTPESNDSSNGRKKWIRLLEGCVSYLQEQGLDIDVDLAKLAILVYSKRNLVCHARIGDPAISKYDLSSRWGVGLTQAGDEANISFMFGESSGC